VIGTSFLRASLAFVACSVVAACAPPLWGSYGKGRFDATGEYHDGARAVPVVAKPEDVRVFYGSAPDGFTLRDNELRVEPGYTHRIVGTAKVIPGPVHCDHEADDTANPGGYGKRQVLAQLRTTAYENGGNAIIYAESYVANNPSPRDGANRRERCDALKRYGRYGSAWVVVLGDAPAAPAVSDPAPSSASPAASSR